VVGGKKGLDAFIERVRISYGKRRTAAAEAMEVSDHRLALESRLWELLQSVDSLAECKEYDIRLAFRDRTYMGVRIKEYSDEGIRELIAALEE